VNAEAALVKVEALNSTNAVIASDVSDAVFSITIPAVVVTAPNGESP